jgi:DNA replication protein DnaC
MDTTGGIRKLDKRLEEPVICWFDEVCVKDKSNCKVCQDKGLHYLCRKIYIEKSMIPITYRYMRVDQLELDPSTEQLIEYFRNIIPLVERGEGFFAYGNKTGTGKTTVGCIALIHYLFHSISFNPYHIENRRVLYLNVPEFMDRLRKSFNNPDLELENLLEELTDRDTAPKLILFDDIGAERPSDWVRERLYTLINYRVSNGLANLYTSNDDIEGIRQKLGNRIASRIELTKPIHFRGGDRRKYNW